MEDRMNEIAANRDLMKSDNVVLQKKVEVSDQQIVRLRNHKNKLIRWVLKLLDENEKSEEKVRELNAQIALMQFRAPPPNPSSGVNIQVFHAPVKLWLCWISLLSFFFNFQFWWSGIYLVYFLFIVYYLLIWLMLY